MPRAKNTPGVLTAADLADWHCPIEAPASFDYHGYTVCKTGPWGQGPVFLQQLAILAGFDLTAAGLLSADYIHTVTESAKLAFADREAWYGDDGQTPLTELLSAAYNDRAPRPDRRRRPRSSCGPDRPAAGRSAAVAGCSRPSRRAGEPTAEAPVSRPSHADGNTRGDTCHLDVVDRWGLHISATPSGGWLQSSPTIAELGFALGTRAQMTWLQDRVSPPRCGRGPGPGPRSVRPWRSRMAAPIWPSARPGGDQQDQWSVQFFLAHVHFGLSLQQAVDAPMFHSTHFPSSFWPRESEPGGLVVESRIPRQTLAELRRRGHRITESGDWSLGRLSAVGTEPGTGFLRAAANPRGAAGYAAGR